MSQFNTETLNSFLRLYSKFGYDGNIESPKRKLTARVFIIVNFDSYIDDIQDNAKTNTDNVEMRIAIKSMQWRPIKNDQIILKKEILHYGKSFALIDNSIIDSTVREYKFTCRVLPLKK